MEDLVGTDLTVADMTLDDARVPVDERDAPAQPGASHGDARPSLLARPLLAMVRGYQTVRAGRPSPCRYWPSCSTYAVEALEVHGAVKGLGLAVLARRSLQPLGWPRRRPRAQRRRPRRVRPDRHVLAWFYALTHNYAIAIALLTLCVMVLLTPLTLKGTKCMLQMQQLQPEMKRLQAEHKGDRQKLNEEMMALYKENNINPLSGCLPLLLQAPVFFILYRVLRA